MTDPIRFFIGTDVNGGCAECAMTLEYSIQKHCSLPYEIHWMAISDDPSSFWHGWDTSLWSTPFSGFRYGIPAYCNYQGKAIYQDDDQIWLSDPVELWNTELTSEEIMTGKRLADGQIRHCVSLIDCENFGSWIDLPITRLKKFPQFTERLKAVTFPLTKIVDGKFNNYDGENAALEDIAVLHFTDMRTNPGVHMAVERLGGQANHWYNGPLLEHRRADCVAKFHEYHDEAVAAGFKIENYLPETRIEYIKQDQSQYQANNGFDVAKGE